VKTLHSQALEPEIAAGPPDNGRERLVRPGAYASHGRHRRGRSAVAPAVAPGESALFGVLAALRAPASMAGRADDPVGEVDVRWSRRFEPSGAQPIAVTSCHATCANDGAPNGAHECKIEEKQNASCYLKRTWCIRQSDCDP
jgi:hypothetical protein